MVRIILAALAINFSSLALAVDFSEADAMYQRRSENVEAANQARALYSTLADQSSGADKLYAISQMSRLDNIRGEIYLRMDEAAERKAIFKSCMTNVERINAQVMGRETEQYYTWKISCLIFWMKVASRLERYNMKDEMKSLFARGLSLTTNDNGIYIGTIEGGAIARYVAAIYSNPTAQAIGMYKPVIARKLIEEAKAADYYQDRAYPEELSGAEFFENVFIDGIALINEENESAARIVFEDGIETIEYMIEDDELPAGRGFETRHQLLRLKDKLAEIN